MIQDQNIIEMKRLKEYRRQRRFKENEIKIKKKAHENKVENINENSWRIRGLEAKHEGLIKEKLNDHPDEINKIIKSKKSNFS